MKKPSEDIVDCSIKVHKTLGPGLLETVYQNCLGYELEKRGYAVKKEVALPVKYENIVFESGFRADLVIENKIIIEIKSVEKLLPVHKAQVLTYLKLTHFPLGFLLNFGEILLKDGMHRFANGEEANTL